VLALQLYIFHWLEPSSSWSTHDIAQDAAHLFRQLDHQGARIGRLLPAKHAIDAVRKVLIGDVLSGVAFGL
jgi:hypothetical protein